jgi:NADPH2:quinone reductase
VARRPHISAARNRFAHTAARKSLLRDALAEAVFTLRKQLRADDLKAQREAAGPNGIDVVYDCVGGASAEAALRSLRSGGRFLVVGFASRTVPSLPLNIVLVKRLDILGVNWPAFVDANPAGYRADMALALAAIADGRITPRTAGEWPLTEIGAALALLDRGTVAGKVVINLG